MRNTLKEFNDRLNITEQKFSEFEDKAIGNIQNETEKEGGKITVVNIGSASSFPMHQ